GPGGAKGAERPGPDRERPRAAKARVLVHALAVDVANHVIDVGCRGVLERADHERLDGLLVVDVHLVENPPHEVADGQPVVRRSLDEEGVGGRIGDDANAVLADGGWAAAHGAANAAHHFAHHAGHHHHVHHAASGTAAHAAGTASGTAAHAAGTLADARLLLRSVEELIEHLGHVHGADVLELDDLEAVAAGSAGVDANQLLDELQGVGIFGLDDQFVADGDDAHRALVARKFLVLLVL